MKHPSAYRKSAATGSDHSGLKKAERREHGEDYGCIFSSAPKPIPLDDIQTTKGTKMRDMIKMYLIMWFFPWGFVSLALWMLGYVGLGALLGSTSAIGIAFVLSMAKAAKGN